MPAAVIVLLVILAIIALVVVAGMSRLHALSRHVGSFPCNARPAGKPAAPFTVGVAWYAVGRIEWYRCWSLSVRPARTWHRGELSVTGRVSLAAADHPEQYVVSCRYDDVDFELLMSAAAYAGLASWLEAAPPGRRDLVL